MSEQKLSDELENITYKIYIYILQNNPEPTRIADIRKHFNIKSHQLTYYHIKKLIDLQLVGSKKIEGTNSYAPGYIAKEFIPLNTLKPYLYLANRYLIPRQLIYMIIFFILTFLSWLTPLYHIAQLAGLIGIIICAYELFKQKL